MGEMQMQMQKAKYIAEFKEEAVRQIDCSVANHLKKDSAARIALRDGHTRVLRTGHQHLESRRRAAGAITAVGVVQRQAAGRKLAGTNLLVRH
jgi:hypothetical protein